MPLNHGYAYRTRVDVSGVSLSLAEYLARRFPHATADEWTARAVAGEITVNGQGASGDEQLRAGMEIVWNRPPWNEPEAPTEFSVVALDESFVAVDKPSGLPTLPGGGFLEQTLLFQARRRFAGAVPMHRLGRGTSGIVLLARTEAARRAFSRDWQRRAVEKRYLAVVQGEAPAHGVVEVPIGPVAHAALGTIHAASASGKRARSEFWRRATRGGLSLVEVLIDTGRAHQIRIHMAAIGHPLAGDPLYRAGGLPAADSTALPGDLGSRLHAWRLGFAHPVTGEAIHLCAPPPATWDDFRRHIPDK